MSSRSRVLVPLAVGWALLGVPAAAQVAVEARIGGSIGNHAPAAAGLETLPGLSATGLAEYAALPYASVYASYFRASFGCEEGFCTDDEVTITSQGFGGGVRLHAGALPWLRAGAAYYGSSVVSTAGETRIPASLGYEIGSGLTIPLGARAALIPGIYYRSQPGDDRTSLLGVELGVRVTF